MSEKKSTSERQSARPPVGRGWKGYALVDVEEMKPGPKLAVEVSSQESNGRSKLRKSKRKK
ncbi:hypothetical protein DFH28DRAFT_983305 [Melampsora americana]|nr:hypothetical protein DFH28DRAFT_983305 [Melampsora americana]